MTEHVDSTDSGAASSRDRHRIQASEPRTVTGALAYDPATGDVKDLVNVEVRSIVPGIEDNATYSCLCGEEFGGDFVGAQEHLSEMLAHGHDVEPIAGSYEELPFSAAFEVLEAVRESPWIDDHERDIITASHSFLQRVQKNPRSFDFPGPDTTDSN